MEILDSKLANGWTAGFESRAAESLSIPMLRVSAQKTPYAIALRKRGGSRPSSLYRFAPHDTLWQPVFSLMNADGKWSYGASDAISMDAGIEPIPENIMISTLVLATVNAPHSKQLDAQELVHCLLDEAAAKAAPGHMSAFFGEVKPHLQVEFAHQFNVTDAQLVAAAKAFAAYSGESYPLAA